MNTNHLGTCTTCGWELRPYRANIHQYPNTRRLAGPGCCTLCMETGPTPEPIFDLNAAASSLGYWLTSRRSRGVPSDGYPV